MSQDSLLPAVAGLPAAAPGGVLEMSNPTRIMLGPVDGSYVFASRDGSQAFFQSEEDLTEAAGEGPPGSERRRMTSMWIRAR